MKTIKENLKQNLSNEVKTKITIYLLFVGFMIIASFGSIFFYYNSAESVLIEQSNEYLEAIAQSRASHIQDSLKQEKEKIDVLRQDHHFSDLLLVSSERTPGYEGYNFEHFQEVIESFIQGEFYEIFVLDINGKIVATTNLEEEIGEDFSTDPLFLGGKENIYIHELHFDEEFNKIGWAISAPIIVENEVLGVVVARIEPNNLYKILLDRTGLGETGETYLVNKENYMITPSRFFPEKHTFLKQKVDTVNSKNCLSMMKAEAAEHIAHGPVSVFMDYREVEVLGTHIYIPEMQWCLLTEIDEKEAIGLLRNELIKSALLILIITTVIMGIFVLISSRLILRRGLKEDVKNE